MAFNFSYNSCNNLVTNITTVLKLYVTKSKSLLISAKKEMSYSISPNGRPEMGEWYSRIVFSNNGFIPIPAVIHLVHLIIAKVLMCEQ